VNAPRSAAHPAVFGRVSVNSANTSANGPLVQRLWTPAMSHQAGRGFLSFIKSPIPMTFYSFDPPAGKYSGVPGAGFGTPGYFRLHTAWMTA